MSFDVDELVFAAIRGHSPDTPQDLVGILGSVDGREKMMLTHEELAGALGRLVAAGRIGETLAHRFHELAGTQPTSSFSGLSIDEYDAACARYRSEFWRKVRGER